jgi:hydrogenase maturation protein HypF
MATAPPGTVERRRLRITGVVQGVGFRPFVHGLAARHQLGGFVLNDGRGVVVEAEGPAEALVAFTDEIVEEAPPLARIDVVEVESIDPGDERKFRIERSGGGGSTALVPPDTATCDDCLRELFDPADRRHRYPFINCTQCGPRFTIVERVPYDRANTTMAGFEMCGPCRAEYEDPGDRRFHAEPIACPNCGPQLRFENAGSESPGAVDVPVGEAALAAAIELIRGGGIVAIKGLGGYHLACDAASEEVVARLRRRKHREEKPLAVMSSDPESLAELGGDELELLRSKRRPILIARRRSTAPLAASIAPGSPRVGLMLPYSPLHHLLCDGFGGPLVMTSGNRSDEPIAFTDDDARDRLGPIADALLSHDRPIHRRCEDSVVTASFSIRRSRGHVPDSIPLPIAADAPLVATGAELKSTFCVVRGRDAFLSPHLGDLDTDASHLAFRTDLELYLEMLGVRPELVAHDLHPDYLSTRWAFEQDVEVVGVQHHHAHAAACLAENGETGPALALVFDGTGYGSDGTLWGGELLRCDLENFTRLAHLEPVPLPGGEAAIRQPWRTAASYLEEAGRPVPFARWSQVRESLKVNAPLSSGMGRLFDAVAALLGVREEVSYEGQAAIELEHLAGDADAAPYGCRVDNGLIRGSNLVAAAHDDLASGRPREQIAAAFHEGVADAAARATAEAAEPGAVVLSGGSFQNLRLLVSTRARLANLGFRVLTHRLVPPNDGGISYGQAAVAARRRARCA